MYKKDFDTWNEDKKKTHEDTPIMYPKQREIWNAKLWVNIWSEADGKRGFYRPVLVLQKVGSMYLVVPMTSQWKENSPFYYKLENVDFQNNLWEKISSSLMLSHIRTIDIRRFFKHKATLPKEEFFIVQKILQEMYFLKDK